MVSIRRRKLLGLCSDSTLFLSRHNIHQILRAFAGRNSFLVQLPRFSDNGNTPENPIQDTKSVSVHPIPSVDVSQPKEINISKICPGSSNISGSSSSKEEQSPQFSVLLFRIEAKIEVPTDDAFVDAENLDNRLDWLERLQEIKRRKRHRRKHFEDQEPCLMRGVYLKNMKWQAAIKVDKKQIHLGTVGSQEEAARLYDRAAFMCGREPNFELSEEEKQELRRYKWDEFLTMTRHAITNKKHQRRLGAGSRKKSELPLESGEWDIEQGIGGFSASEDAEPETSVS
ncbi:hypothetical protein HHK36_013083 [Tetracentron sinense]|uniref:AP2/ERF domain-containing protein n=1 Tax=Tetracentron sinense TaxID=13715 RepID=A0A834ZA66_TETSI|nr:hypothetical protein HHK36_013083 [Tetracentron sinense]